VQEAHESLEDDVPELLVTAPVEVPERVVRQLSRATGGSAHLPFRHGVEEEERAFVVDRRELAERRRLHIDEQRGRPDEHLLRAATHPIGVADRRVVGPILDREPDRGCGVEGVLGGDHVAHVERDVVVDEEHGPPARHAGDGQAEVPLAAEVGPARLLGLDRRGW
jgi:hypothetical protein